MLGESSKYFTISLTIISITISRELNSVSSVAIENGVEGVEIQCHPRSIELLVKLQRPLFQDARIFVKGKSMDPDCGVQYAYEPGRQADMLTFNVPHDRCGMEREGRRGTLMGTTYCIAYVVSFHSVFLTKVDRVYRLVCTYTRAEPKPENDVTASFSVSMLPPSELNPRPLPPDPTCSYRVYVGNRTRPARYARIGDKVRHEWKCSDLTDSQYIFVHSCFVSPEFGDGKMIIDSNGCSLDPIVLGQVEYQQPTAADNEGESSASSYHLATASHHAYKFADYPTLLFKCRIRICSEAACGPPNYPLNCQTGGNLNGLIGGDNENERRLLRRAAGSFVPTTTTTTTANKSRRTPLWAANNVDDTNKRSRKMDQKLGVGTIKQKELKNNREGEEPLNHHQQFPQVIPAVDEFDVLSSPALRFEDETEMDISMGSSTRHYYHHSDRFFADTSASSDSSDSVLLPTPTNNRNNQSSSLKLCADLNIIIYSSIITAAAIFIIFLGIGFMIGRKKSSCGQRFLGRKNLIQ